MRLKNRTFVVLPLMLLALITLPALAVDTSNYGSEITIKKATVIDEIMKHPVDFKDKEVRIEGVVTEVCQGSGCWIKLKGTDEVILAKSADHKILVPKDSIGKYAVVQGKVQVMPAVMASESGTPAKHCGMAAQAATKAGDGKGCCAAMKAGSKGCEGHKDVKAASLSSETKESCGVAATKAGDGKGCCAAMKAGSKGCEGHKDVKAASLSSETKKSCGVAATKAGDGKGCCAAMKAGSKGCEGHKEMKTASSSSSSGCPLKAKSEEDHECPNPTIQVYATGVILSAAIPTLPEASGM